MFSRIKSLFPIYKLKPNHPEKVCMTYWSHMRFSLYLSSQFAIASVGAFFHAIYPDILITHSSDTISKLSSDMKKIGCRENEPEKN